VHDGETCRRLVRALITEHGSNRGALAAARALARAGWTVDVAYSEPGMTASSRAVGRAFAVPSPHEDRGGFVDAVAGAIEDTGAEVVFPADETQLLALSRHRDRLGAILPYASHEVLRRATDRLEVARLAERTGLGTPATWRPGDLREWSGPVVVKGRHPALVEDDGGASRVETRIGTAVEARQWIAELEAAGHDAVVQQLALGRLASVSVLTDGDGVVRSESHQVTDRMWPPEAGVSTRARIVPADPGLSERISVLLAELGWVGLAQLQFIVDAQGRANLIDFNPRFYGSLSLALAGGINFPASWAALATGRPVPAPRPPRIGLRYQWLGGDLRRAARERRGGLAHDVVNTLRWGDGAVHPIWSVRDPRPAARCAAAFMRGRLQREAAPHLPESAQPPGSGRFSRRDKRITA
jgi:predicted ATP-grasp superfamily ATP-dependent carboligase